MVAAPNNNDYNVYFDYTLSITTYLGGNCGPGNTIEFVAFLSALWDDTSNGNIYSGIYAPSALHGGTCSTINKCDATYTSNVTVSLPGQSEYQPRVATEADVFVSTNDYLDTVSASVHVDESDYNTDCGRDDGVTLTSMSMYGWAGGGAIIEDPDNSTLG